MKRTDYKGITLIALVITIIVLLILAGVSISMVAGDNGILTQSVNSATETDIAGTKEEIELAVVGYYDDKGKYTVSDVETAVQDVLGDTAEITEEDGVYTVTTTKGNIIDITYIISGATDGSSSSGALATSVITASNYGDKINYSANGVTDWKIFYNDGSNIYIITSDYLENNLIPSEAGMTSNNTYGAYWDSLSATSFTNTQSGFMFNGLSSVSTGNNNYYAAAHLLDTSTWSSFVNTSCADYAIGSPTVEMWVASWNDKMYTPTLYTPVSTTGYYVGTKSDATSNYVDLSDANRNIRYPFLSSFGYLRELLWVPPIVAFFVWNGFHT